MAQLVRALPSGMCRVKRHRFEPGSVPVTLYHLPWTVSLLRSGQQSMEMGRMRITMGSHLIAEIEKDVLVYAVRSV